MLELYDSEVKESIGPLLEFRISGAVNRTPLRI
jgi:hypothetical protein